MQTPLFTVLIDTYNYGQYVERAIESAVEQDCPAADREILVVDDGSTDDTPERIRKYGAKVTYLRKSNGGQASAFNYGLAKARGKFVALLDADDYWLPGKLGRVAEEFEKQPDTGMVYHSYSEYDAGKGAFRESGLPVLSGF